MRSSHSSINNARLQKLILELKTQFQLENITAISYALAICINSNRTTKANHSETRYLLANRNMLAREFASTYNYTFYLQTFYLIYRNISSNYLPIFLNLLFAAIKGNISN
ncbi:hypothetical protein RB213_002129 [Colletotrichum asianum]